MSLKKKYYSGKVKALKDADDATIVSESKKLVRFVINTGDVDRDGDIIDPSGIDFKGYFETNPIILYNHDPYEHRPIAKTVDIALKDGYIEATAEFHCLTDISREVYDLIQAGVLSAASIGVIPLSFEDAEIEGQRVRRINRAELLEWSVVPVPSNRGALIAKAIDMQKVNSEMMPTLADMVSTYLQKTFNEDGENAKRLGLGAAQAASDYLQSQLRREDEASSRRRTDETADAPAGTPTTPGPRPNDKAFDMVEKAGRKISAQTEAMLKENVSKILDGANSIAQYIEALVTGTGESPSGTGSDEAAQISASKKSESESKGNNDLERARNIIFAEQETPEQKEKIKDLLKFLKTELE